MLRKTK